LIRRVAAASLVAPLCAVVLGACGEPVLLGGDQEPSILACKGLSCGAPCLPASCPPDAGPCDVTEVKGACDPGGTCVATPPMCPQPPPCEGKPCGAKCTPCDPMMPGCMSSPMACDEHGACVDAMMAMCMPPYDPCMSKPCGAMCTKCDPDDPDCMEPPGTKTCDPMGDCMQGPVMCPP
jgi:hypothetical protein